MVGCVVFQTKLLVRNSFFLTGFGKSPGYTTVAWGGDQNVDFSYADGLMSVIPAALSMGMSGKLQIKSKTRVTSYIVLTKRSQNGKKKAVQF